MNAGTRRVIAAVALAALAAPGPSWAKCPPDAVQVGPVCVDKYEASVWSIPNPTTTNKRLLAKLQSGKATLADLTAGGATQLGVNTTTTEPEYPASFPENGNWTTPAYAVSVPGVLPGDDITWFQAEQACLLAGKRLLLNHEWQGAAAGTPDPAGGVDDGATECNVGTAGVPVNTGSRSACVSKWGAYDMVGNVDEWVADWGPHPNAPCPGWGDATGDAMCFSGASTAVGPGAPFRGGWWGSPSASAGVFSVRLAVPYGRDDGIGFRCAR
jgi:formylglycine-generating enzyme required for sulfatase activity